jgi:hypothetical protein
VKIPRGTYKIHERQIKSIVGFVQVLVSIQTGVLDLLFAVTDGDEVIQAPF